MAMDAETLYRRIGRLIEVAPPAPTTETLSVDLMKWIGQVAAVLKESRETALLIEVNAAVSPLNYPNRKVHFQNIMVALYKALAIAELDAPQSAQGAFIPVGNSFDAFAALSKILGAATRDVLIVDPYLDESVLTDFAGSMQESVPLRLLTDKASVKPGLAPAVLRWQSQYANRPLEARLAARSSLTAPKHGQ